MRSMRRTDHMCPDLKSFRMARSINVPNSMLLPQFAVFCVLTAPLHVDLPSQLDEIHKYIYTQMTKFDGVTAIGEDHSGYGNGQ